MSRLFHLLQGYADIEACGAYPELLLNRCAEKQVRFWRLQKLDATTFRFRVRVQDLEKLQKLAQETMCSVEELGLRGMVPAVARLKGRWGFLLGLTFCLFFAAWLSRFIWVIDVQGNDSVPSEIILAELRRQGVRIGAWGPSVLGREVSNEALRHLPDLSWMNIHVAGVRALVSVREVEEPPVLLDEDVPADVVSREDGVIVSLEIQSGRPLYQVGDAVAKGETVITGRMELLEPEGSPVDLGWYVVRAVGSVRAQVSHALEETIPLTAMEKQYTGATSRGVSLRFLQFHFNFSENSSHIGARYDRMAETRMYTVPLLRQPVYCTVETLRGYTLQEVPIDQAAEEMRLQEILSERLQRLMEARDGEILSTAFRTRIDGGCLTVTLLADCVEEIGRTAVLPGETGRYPGGQGAPPA